MSWCVKTQGSHTAQNIKLSPKLRRGLQQIQNFSKEFTSRFLHVEYFANTFKIEIC